MKKIIIAILVLSVLASALPAQGISSAIGVGFILQNMNYDYLGDTESITLGSLALNLDFFSGSSFGMYSSIAFGLVVGGEDAVNGTSGEIDMDFYDTAMSMSALAGIGAKFELGPIALTAGAGADLELAMLMSNDYYDADFIFVGIGPGVGATASFDLGNGFGVYAGVRASYILFDILSTVEADFTGGFSIVPHAGISFKK